jgi:hypothetical protein
VSCWVSLLLFGFLISFPNPVQWDPADHTVYSFLSLSL